MHDAHEIFAVETPAGRESVHVTLEVVVVRIDPGEREPAVLDVHKVCARKEPPHLMEE